MLKMATISVVGKPCRKHRHQEVFHFGVEAVPDHFRDGLGRAFAFDCHLRKLACNSTVGRDV